MDGFALNLFASQCSGSPLGPPASRTALVKNSDARPTLLTTRAEGCASNSPSSASPRRNERRRCHGCSRPSEAILERELWKSLG